MVALRRPAQWLGLMLTSSFASTCLASGFLLHEQNASGLGEFYSGSAAIVDNASINYFNPAGLVHLSDMEFAVSGTNISTGSTFRGDTFYSTTLGTSITQTGKATGDVSRMIPTAHASMKWNDKLAFGISATAPFGLATSYSETSIVRYQAIYSELKTMNIGPSVAYKIRPWLSIGAGPDAQYSEVKLSKAARFSGSTDTISKLSGDSWAWGYHAGIMANKGKMSAGLNFRSEFAHHYTGSSKFGQATRSNIKADADLPWLIDASGAYVLNDDITLLATISYVHWSSITKLEIRNGAVQIAGNNTTTTTTDPLNYRDAWTFTGGARYQFNDQVMLKIGGGYDQTPTNHTDRDMLLPDNDRWIASAGIRYVPVAAKKVTLDLGYTHLFLLKAPVHKDASTTGAVSTTNRVNGNVSGHANIVGGQISVKI